jgi:shikimate dehydrogenase
LNFSGASVTIPHKEDMCKLVDEADENCLKSGATNTVTFKDGTIVGNNTDVEALRLIAPNAKRVLILGGGGVARAAIVAMTGIGANVFVATRNSAQAEQLSDELPCSVAPESCLDIDTLINCTPVGMKGGNDEHGDPALALSPMLEFTCSLLVIDTVYTPTNTPLIQRAVDAGCTTVTGDEMFRLQAVAQQKIWATSR